MRVVSDKQTVVLVHLHENASAPMTCGEVQDVLECARLLNGRHIATGFEVADDGIRTLEGKDVLVPLNPREGQEWVVDQIDSQCASVRRIVAATRAEIRIQSFVRCTNALEKRLLHEERWTRGGGLREVSTAEQRIDFIPVNE